MMEIYLLTSFEAIVKKPLACLFLWTRVYQLLMSNTSTLLLTVKLPLSRVSKKPFLFIINSAYKNSLSNRHHLTLSRLLSLI